MHIGLFIGLESYSWTTDNFTTAAKRAQQFGIDTLFVKVADGTNLWYGGYAGIDAMRAAVTDEDIAFVPYIFSYANTLGGYAGEVAIVNHLIDSGYTVCVDMESQWNGNTALAAQLVRDLKAPVYISTWADPQQQHWAQLLPLLQNRAIAFLPQVYTTYLTGVWKQQYAGVPSAQIIPTYSAETLVSAFSSPSFTLWEYGSLTDALLAQFVPQEKPPMTVLSSSGEVATFPQPVSQFQPGKSAYECVAFSAALCHYMGPPNGTPTGTPAQVIATAEQWYQTEEGTNSSANTNGMSLDAEYAMLNGLSMTYTPLPISAQTLHNNDMANVAAALQQGRPVLMCGAENGFYDVGLGDIVPYGWTPTGNHCVVATGIAPSGNFYVRDMANVGHGLSPGSQREYDTRHLDLISGTAIVPSWTVAPPAPTLLTPNENDLGVWNLLQTMLANAFPMLPKLPTIPCDPTHAIPQSWLVGRWKHGYNFGTPLQPEQDMTSVYKTPYTVMEQEFTHARASWHSDTNRVTWYDGRGVIAVL